MNEAGRGRPFRDRHFYGRRVGKALRADAQRRMDELLPKIAVPDVDIEDNPARTKIDPFALFENQAPLWLEIGFGGGEHLAQNAARREDVNFFGAEPYLNGVASALRHIEMNALSNVRLHYGDARDLLDILPDSSLSRVYILYPDPWPKARHAERRFFHPNNLKALYRVMDDDAELRLASDIPEYIEHARNAVECSNLFCETDRDILSPWQNWFSTRYEQKAFREGRVGHYLIFKKKV